MKKATKAYGQKKADPEPGFAILIEGETIEDLIANVKDALANLEAGTMPVTEFPGS